MVHIVWPGPRLSADAHRGTDIKMTAFPAGPSGLYKFTFMLHWNVGQNCSGVKAAEGL